jgi:hypothetical protein
MSDKVSRETALEAPRKGKRNWVRPVIDVAAARQAEGSFSMGGTADYGIYS